MPAHRERQVVSGVPACHVEAVRVVEVRRVPVGRAEHAVNDISLRDADAADLRVARRVAGGRLDRGLPAQRLLDRQIERGGARPRSLDLLWMREQRPHRVRDHGFRRLDPAEEDDERVGADFVRRERVDVVAYQVGEERPIWFLREFLENGFEHPSERVRRPLAGRAQLRIALEVRQRPGEVFVPLVHAARFGERDAEHREHRMERHRPGHSGPHFPAATAAGPQRLHEPVDLRPQGRQGRRLHPRSVKRGETLSLVADLRWALGRHHVGAEHVADRGRRVRREEMGIPQDGEDVVAARQEPALDLRNPGHGLRLPQFREGRIGIDRQVGEPNARPERKPVDAALAQAPAPSAAEAEVKSRTTSVPRSR